MSTFKTVQQSTFKTIDHTQATTIKGGLSSRCVIAFRACPPFLVPAMRKRCLARLDCYLSL